MLPAMPKLCYFAQLVDAFGIASEDFQLEADPTSVAELLAELAKRRGVWQRVLSQPQNLRIAINKSFAEPDTAVGQSDEIAFVASGPIL